MEVYISITNQTDGKKVVKLPDFPIRIGRGADNHITLNDELCSSKHLIISKTKDSVLIKDLQSKNGVALNGIKVFNQKIYIKDEVRLGNTVISIEKENLCQSALKSLSSKNNNRLNGEITIELERSARIKSIKGSLTKEKVITKNDNQKSIINKSIIRVKQLDKRIVGSLLFLVVILAVFLNLDT